MRMPFRFGLPGRVVVPLVISQDFSGALTAGSFLYSLQGNHVNDPYNTHSADKPRMHSFWSLAYHDHIVHSCKINVVLTAVDTDLDKPLTLIVFPHFESSTPAVTSVEELKTMRFARWKSIGSRTTSDSFGHLKHYMGVKRLFNVPSLKNTIEKENQFVNAVTEDPDLDHTMFWAVYIKNTYFETAVSNFRIRITMTMYTEYLNRRYSLPE